VSLRRRNPASPPVPSRGPLPAGAAADGLQSDPMGSARPRSSPPGRGATDDAVSRVSLRLASLLRGRRWRLRVVGLCLLATIVLGLPPYLSFTSATSEGAWKVVLLKRDHPLTHITGYDPSLQPAKRDFRLLPPLLARLLGLGPRGLYAAEHVAAGALLLLCLDLAYAETRRRSWAALVCLSVSTIYAGRAGLVDVFPYFDVFALTGLVAAMRWGQPLVVFGALTLACWTDERALVALPAVAVWWTCGRTVRRPAVSAALSAGAAYLLGRAVLAQAFGLRTPVEGTLLFWGQTHLVALGSFTFLEGLWIPVVVALLELLRLRAFRLGLAYAACVCATAFVAFSVEDITRSGSYLLPAALLSIRILAGSLRPRRLRGLLCAAAIVCVLFPAASVIGNVWVVGEQPLPLILLLQGLRWLQGLPFEVVDRTVLRIR
jgi:hypothetical protein